MAVTKTVLKNSDIETVVKVAGTGAAATISLATDLPTTKQVVPVGTTPTAVISGLQWTGAADGIVTITRNSVVVATLQANAAGALEMNGQMMIPDATESASNIVVTISGAQAECWIRIKKTSGYQPTVEYFKYGSYDDETIVGAKDISGSPDYTG